MDRRDVGKWSQPGLLATASRYIVRRALAVSLMAYAAGVGLLFFLPALSSSTYVDENSLLPGSATPRFGALEAMTAVHLAADLTHALTVGGDRSRVMRGWIQRHLADTGADVHLQRQSVVAVVRARQGSGDEAMLLVTPFREGSDAQLASTSLTLALALTLFRLLQDSPWLARDVIWVVADGGEQAVAQWLHHYHHPRHPTSPSSTPFVRGGVLSTAVVFEIESEWQGGPLDAVVLLAEGVDGQMPNLDVLVALDHLAASAGLATHPAHSLLASMLHQARGVGSGAHSPFREYQVDAATLQAVSRGGGGAGGLAESVERQGRVLEGFLRCGSNLAERLHHSSFLYLLPAPNRFVSIGVYIIPFLLLLLPLPLTLIAIAFSPASTRPVGLVGVLEGETVSAALRVAAVHVWALAVAAAPPLVTKAVGGQLHLQVMWGGSVAASLCCLPQAKAGEGTAGGALTLVTTALSLGAVCCYNFSLALPAVLLMVPLAVATCSPSPPLPLHLHAMKMRRAILMVVVAGVAGGGVETRWQPGGMSYPLLACACLPCLVLCCSGRK